MIYYYQIVNKPLTHKILSGETCPVCNKKDTLELTLYMTYISALVPFYGMGRRTSVHCTVCNHIIKPAGASVFAKKNYSANIENEIKNIRTTHKRTTWQLLYPWTGCWIILGLIAMGLIMKVAKQFETNKTNEILANPQAGDIYKTMWTETGNDPNFGTLVKVIRINKDTLFVQCSRNHMPENANYYNEKEWDKIPSDNDAFEPKERKIILSEFVKSTDFYEYAKDKFSPTIAHGYVLGKGKSNLSFDVLERK